MSPYLFTMVMEAFSGILYHKAAHTDFGYFWRCKPTRLSHLFFADDVFLFCRADLKSVSLLKEGLDLFSDWSGLRPNNNKSEVFLAGGPPALRNDIISTWGFAEGTLPVRYLGVPIISSRLGKADCAILVDRILARVQSWTHRFLSFAGRLQLIRSVLHAIQAYWASIFTIPLKVLDRIEQILRQFLWKGPSLGQSGAKVSWEDVCCPKDEGGLGIRRLRDCNKASMLKHIWILFTDKESLWCKWIHSTFLKKYNFWAAKVPACCSWAWKGILRLRTDFRLNFRWQVGDGRSISLWYDNWLQVGPLELFCHESSLLDPDLQSTATVEDLYTPVGAEVRQFLDSWGIPIPTLSSVSDNLTWNPSSDGRFSVAAAWEVIRRKKSKVNWASFIWNNAITPRHQFILWLITRKRLPTQSFLISYGRIGFAVCPFCKSTPDSIDHLFFQCSFTASIAFSWAMKCNLPWRNGTWEDNLRWAIRFLSGRDFYHTIGRFSFGALCHLVWKYRNDIIFRGHSITAAVVKKHLIRIVKDKAFSFKNIEDTPRNRRIQRSWDLDASIFAVVPH